MGGVRALYPAGSLFRMQGVEDATKDWQRLLGQRGQGA